MPKRLFENNTFANAALAVQTTGDRLCDQWKVKNAEQQASVAYAMERSIGKEPKEARRAYFVALAEGLRRDD